MVETEMGDRRKTEDQGDRSGAGAVCAVLCSIVHSTACSVGKAKKKKEKRAQVLCSNTRF